MDSDRSRLEITASPRKAKLTLLVVSAAGISLLLASGLAADESWGVRAFWFAGAVVCAAVALVNRDVTLGRKPLLVADHEGLHHEKVGIIPWSDVQWIEAGSQGVLGQSLGIEVSDKHHYRARHPNPFMRLNMRIASRTRYPFLVIPGKLLDTSPEELKAELERIARRTF